MTLNSGLISYCLWYVPINPTSPRRESLMSISLDARASVASELPRFRSCRHSYCCVQFKPGRDQAGYGVLGVVEQEGQLNTSETEKKCKCYSSSFFFLSFNVFAVNAVFDLCQRNKRYPCFVQLDLAVRKLLSIQGNNGFVPPFVIVWTTNTKEDPLSKAQILFTRECAVPPQTLMQFWPNTCGGVSCKEPDCELLRMPRDGKDKAWVLSADGGLVSDVS